MSDERPVVDLSAKRWEGNEDPTKFKPVEALRAALRDIESGNIAPDHVVIVMGRGTGSEGNTRFYQAGSFGYYAQIGLVSRLRDIIA